jgi:antitoxin (DNA-binding transcriptional repressor) of toxin-antitoxin stability system
MQTIALEQLDASASQWLRRATFHEPIIVTDNGRPILTLTITPPPRADSGGGLAHRVLLPGFAELMNRPIGGTGITEILEQDREDRW